MRKISYLLVVIGACLFNSCSEEKVPSSKTSAFPDAQVLISDFNVVEKDSRSQNGNSVSTISFTDSISGNSYQFDLQAYSDKHFGSDFNFDGVPELEMTLGENNRIIGKMDGYVNTLLISREEKDGYVFYTFKEENPSRAYTHISWWGCVTRLASNSTISTIGLVTGGVAMAGALALICLDDRNRWEVN